METDFKTHHFSCLQQISLNFKCHHRFIMVLFSARRPHSPAAGASDASASRSRRRRRRQQLETDTVICRRITSNLSATPEQIVSFTPNLDARLRVVDSSPYDLQLFQISLWSRLSTPKWGTHPISCNTFRHCISTMRAKCASVELFIS